MLPKRLLRISIKNDETGENYKIELYRMISKKFMIRFNDKKSIVTEYKTLTEFAIGIRKLIVIIVGRKRRYV